jgi:hypothetical protein
MALEIAPKSACSNTRTCIGMSAFSPARLRATWPVNGKTGAACEAAPFAQ